MEWTGIEEMYLQRVAGAERRREERRERKKKTSCEELKTSRAAWVAPH